MIIELLAVEPPRKASMLATAKIRLTFSEGYVVDVDDIRILKNNRQELWISLPTYSVPEGRGYRYAKSVELSRGLLRQVEDVVLDGYRAWSKTQEQTSQVGGLR